MTEKYTETVLHRPDPAKVRMCSECKHVNDKGFCSSFMYFAEVRGACLIEPTNSR